MSCMQVAELTQTIAGLHERREEQEKEGSSKEATVYLENFLKSLDIDPTLLQTTKSGKKPTGTSHTIA